MRDAVVRTWRWWRYAEWRHHPRASLVALAILVVEAVAALYLGDWLGRQIGG